MPELPPPHVVREAEKARAELQRQSRELAPPPFALLEMIMGVMVSRAVHVVAELKVAEALAEGPLSAEELAGRVGADADALGRVLRLLASNGVFATRADGTFELTPMADALRADHPMSMRPIALLMGHPIHWEDWSGFPETVVTGEPALPKLRGMHAFEFLTKNAEYGQVFFEGMGSMSASETGPIVAAYDFTRFGTVVDFCGGQGGLLAGILASSPATRGVLYDPRVEENGAAEFLAAQGVADRTERVAGDLFEVPPGGADAYVLKHIVHDWPEEQALQILRNVRAAIKPGGRLLIAEMVIPEQGDEPHSGKLVDLWLMLLVGGRERTPGQYADLLARAGFRLERVVETAAAISLVEAVPV
ncbi:putative O-methyltransferase [Streptomyces ambofaciens ATCC 23877]|nr:acetylserotonin O-methyltransferase [Streptomyces ambofaciens]AAR30145.1 putative O-methyltransferase [Streptomyces ambofaciens ATCC 23877]AKZ53238.1 putative O-methyltransferase [Streptomyces ambofaciens ATCC 23877]AKZ60525.1 putative O-methyltransferase [Streptomyces ambofaciens ATCC 23877]CAI78088.1 putative O-methyltransferase [Streptomyces ambofaciens ATCC 23877]CAI78362.1 putative O-methyltransferase [Streptomyces ambofaciens ATCC 23877]